MVQGQPEYKVQKTQPQPIKTAGHGGSTVIPATWGSIKKRAWVKAGPGVEQDPISKIPTAKRATVLAYVGERQPSKCKAPNSNLSTAPAKKDGIIMTYLLLQSKINFRTFTGRIIFHSRALRTHYVRSGAEST
jgi:hypothetical protein